MKEQELDLFTSEFRHEQVVKFIRDILAGRVQVPALSGKTASNNRLADNYVKIARSIERYASSKLNSKQRESLESYIFQSLIHLKFSGTLIDNVSPSFDELQKLHEKVDSTNQYLERIAEILNQLVSILEPTTDEK